MTDRERFIATLTFHKPDRVPFSPGGGRESTLRAWHAQGLPPEVQDDFGYMLELLGIRPEPAVEWVSPGLDFLMRPQFEEKILERRPPPPGSAAGTRGSLVVQDWKGNICEISDEFDPRYLRNAIDFVTRSWIKCPVASRADWPDMTRRYDAGDPARFPPDWAARCAKLRSRTYVSGISLSGPFWQLREWLGFEGLCMLFLDDPVFVREMVRFWQAFVAQLLTRIFRDYVPDHIVFNEDMAYKEKPMIGPEMAREFLLPCWRSWVEICRAAGVPVIEVDSDGCVAELIPVWIEAGVNCNSPLEVAAGNDLPAYRRRYGTHMAWRGGVDKRAMARGGNVLRAELERLRPVIEAGGFIPSCDHAVPADVSWPNYVDYCRQLAKLTGWL